MDYKKIIFVVNLLKQIGITSDFCSPNTVAYYAYNHGINLSSCEVVYISDNYKNKGVKNEG